MNSLYFNSPKNFKFQIWKMNKVTKDFNSAFFLKIKLKKNKQELHKNSFDMKITT